MIFDFLTIPQALRQVKFKSKFVMLLLGAPSILGCQSGPLGPARAQDFHTDRAESHPNYLVMSLQYEPAAEMRKKLEAQEGLKLKHRGEAHITVITPPEFDVLKNTLSIQEIDQIAQANGLQKASFEIVCIGKGQVSPALATYFVVIKSNALVSVRKEIEKSWREKGGKGDFQAEHFHPHITLGFTERDLHEADGVIKDERSCQSDLSPR